MKAARIVLGGVLVVTGLLAGCATPTGTADRPGSPTASAAPPAATLPTVSLTRTGGFAGVNQSITIAADGTWTYADKRGSTSSTGQFTQAQLAQLAQLALDPRIAQEALQTSGTVCNDAFHYTVAIGGQNATFEDCGGSRPAIRAMVEYVAQTTDF